MINGYLYYFSNQAYSLFACFPLFGGLLARSAIWSTAAVKNHMDTMENTVAGDAVPVIFVPTTTNTLRGRRNKFMMEVCCPPGIYLLRISPEQA